MKKIFLYIGITFLSIVLLLATCNMQTNYSFGNNPNKIISVQIIKIPEEREEEIIILKELFDDEKDSFISDFRKIPCYKYFNDPATHMVGIGIKFIYDNGDYEIIDSDSQEKSINGKYKMGWNYFEKEEFEYLIYEYLK